MRETSESVDRERQSPAAAPLAGPALYARAALERLTELRLAPTPENYARVYRQVAEPGRIDPEHAGEPPGAPDEVTSRLRALADRLGSAAAELARRIVADHEQVTAALAALRSAESQRDVLVHLAEIIATAHALEQRMDAGYTEIVRMRADVEQIAADNGPEPERIDRDALTRIPGMHGAEAIVGRALAQAQRSKKPLALAVIDVDRFSAINGEFGHHAGDRALVHLVQLVRSALRRSDAVLRHGSDSLLAVLHETDLRAAGAAFERLRAVLRQQPLDYGGATVAFTVSVGVAEAGDEETCARLVERAERALKDARARGGDTIARHLA